MWQSGISFSYNRVQKLYYMRMNSCAYQSAHSLSIRANNILILLDGKELPTGYAFEALAGKNGWVRARMFDEEILLRGNVQILLESYCLNKYLGLASIDTVIVKSD